MPFNNLTPRNAARTSSASRVHVELLNDNDLSEITKQEVLFWSRKLKLSVSQLFSLPQLELETQLANTLEQEAKEERQRAERKQINQNLKHLTLKNYEDSMSWLDYKPVPLPIDSKRLTGGANYPRTVWDILADAAAEIERLYVRKSSYPVKPKKVQKSASDTSLAPCKQASFTTTHLHDNLSPRRTVSKGNLKQRNVVQDISNQQLFYCQESKNLTRANCSPFTVKQPLVQRIPMPIEHSSAHCRDPRCQLSRNRCTASKIPKHESYHMAPKYNDLQRTQEILRSNRAVEATQKPKGRKHDSPINYSRDNFQKNYEMEQTSYMLSTSTIATASTGIPSISSAKTNYNTIASDFTNYSSPTSYTSRYSPFSPRRYQNHSKSTAPATPAPAAKPTAPSKGTYLVTNARNCTTINSCECNIIRCPKCQQPKFLK